MADPRIAAVLTTGRQDYGILRSTLLCLRNDPSFELRLLVGGMHLSPTYGMTVRRIEEDGFSPLERLDWLSGQERPDGSREAAVVEEAGRVLELVGEALSRRVPDFLMLVGDRYETACAAMAAALCRVPIVHLHGGEETEGAFDNIMRHATTKLSHLHLVSRLGYAERVLQMGEDPGSVHVVGPPGLDNLFRDDLPSRSELEKELGSHLTSPVVLVTLHPTTLYAGALPEVDVLLAAMERVEASYVITLPNCDPGNEYIRTRLQEFAAGRPRVAVTEALGDRFMPVMMRAADAMLGNSSSALIEAPALGLPAVNVGDRQMGRHQGDNVISVAADVEQVTGALRQALTPEFRKRCEASVAPAEKGKIGQAIVALLRQWKAPHPPRKHFCDLQLQCARN